MIIFFCRDAPWHVRTGVGFWMGVYDNWDFCRDDVYIVPISEWEIFPSLGGCPQGGGFCSVWVGLYKWITYILINCNFVGTAMARPYGCGIMDGKFMIIGFFV